MKTVLKYIETIPKEIISALSFLLVVFLAFIDRLSGYEVSFSIFYLLPVLTATWYVSRRYGVVISVFSAIMWYLADLPADYTYAYSHFIIPVWNSFMRLGFFLIVTFSLAEIRNLLDKEKSMARNDFLTGVANSLSFNEIATKEIERTSRFIHPLSLAYIDIDNFKQVNDSFGHSAGDKLLHSVAVKIKENIRSIDTVSRLGGDEFAVLMPETNAENAMVALNNLRHNLLEMAHENNWPITFSIGVVTCSESCKLDELIKEADNLMYTVKASGKNRIESKVHSFNNTNA